MMYNGTLTNWCMNIVTKTYLIKMVFKKLCNLLDLKFIYTICIFVSLVISKSNYCKFISFLRFMSLYFYTNIFLKIL